MAQKYFHNVIFILFYFVVDRDNCGLINNGLVVPDVYRELKFMSCALQLQSSSTWAAQWQ